MIQELQNILQLKERNQNIGKTHFQESVFRKVLYLSGVLIIVLIAGIFFTLLFDSLSAVRTLGLKFLYGSTWDPVTSNFGSLPFLIGTLLTSFYSDRTYTPNFLVDKEII